MKQARDHSELVTKGVALHNRFKYEDALPFLERAHELAPQCPAAIYNLANTLHMLGSDKKAFLLLTALTQSPPEAISQSCADLRAPRSFQVDAYYLLFHVVLHSTRSWRDAVPYARKHLALRGRGLRSVWSRYQIKREINQLKLEWQR